MKKLGTIIVILACMGGTTSLLMSNKQKQAGQIRDAQKPLVTTVSTAPVTQQSFSEAAQYVGKTECWREVTMNATTQGTIRTLTAHLDGPVREGQPLLTVDTELTNIALAQADAQLHKAQTDLARYETLHRENNVPTTDVENARLQVRTLETQRLTLRKQLREAVVKSPISGIVTTKLVEPGMFIAPGSPLMTITDMSAVKLVVGVPEAEVGQFRPGRQVVVQFDMYPGQSVTGIVRQIRLKGGDTGKFPVEIRVNNTPNVPLRVGMTASISVPNASRASGLAIPRTALVTTSATPAVYVIQGKHLSLRSIQPGHTFGTTLLVNKGLQAGEQVIISGTEGLKEGQTVVVSQ
ncbi:efflux RND transporter periplasmic adaptor subunit [Fibrella forsythiae]|uniref:Efflux RND transporter periplasmic adaptor subunit n=1 Tax=Fibrella forsythiae TaxID=2817061 RepID=A0ABS3JRG8_9BACT|nr:efflux RND transporter periplasmic adaptor subunit [Fibrella forsythiae]MBO0952583.1 efflux RND transporter periplasmic adaptor subunit [Fibrella forsythiae]